MKPKVYVETSVISVLVARPTRDVILAARQVITRNWWQTDGEMFDLHSSDIVQLEAARGDPAIAQLRLEYVASLPRLPVTPVATNLAEQFIAAGILPAKAATDALHVAIASVHNMEYLLTWNCAHLANVAIRKRLGRYLTSFGYNVPTICTPQELPGDMS